MSNGSLYKYLPAQYAREMVSRGTILLRAPAWFREQEKKDVARGDRSEGTREVGIPYTTWPGKPPMDDESEAFVRKTLFPNMLKMIDEGSLSMTGNSRVIEATRSPPGTMLYCMSSTLSADLQREFGTDTVVEIRNPDALAQCVCNALGRIYGGRRAARERTTFIAEMLECVYTELPVSPKDPLRNAHPCLLKDSRFKMQCEVRLVVHGNHPAFQSRTELPVHVPELVGACGIVVPPPASS
jgi:hypothetical protein